MTLNDKKKLSVTERRTDQQSELQSGEHGTKKWNPYILE